jgi:hypothetical protein
MNKPIIATVSAAVGLVAAVVFGLFGCSSKEQASVAMLKSYGTTSKMTICQNAFDASEEIT